MSAQHPDQSDTPVTLGFFVRVQARPGKRQ